MQTLAEAITEAVARQNQLFMDPLAATIAVLAVIAYLALRLLGKRKSMSARIAEMEDHDFPVDESDPEPRKGPPAEPRSDPRAAPAPRDSSG